MSVVDERRRQSVKERMKRWEEVAVASRPSPRRVPKPRPRANRRPGSAADMTTESQMHGAHQTEIHQERQLKISDQALAKSDTLTGKAELENPKPEQHSPAMLRVKSLSPSFDQLLMSTSTKSPPSSPFGDRKMPAKPLPYAEHKKLVSPRVIRKAKTMDVIPPSLYSKVEAVPSRPRLPTPRLDTMTPQPYKSRSSSVSSSGSPTNFTTRRLPSVTSPVSVSPPPRVNTPSQDSKRQRQTTPEGPPKPQTQPKPAIRPKSAVPMEKSEKHPNTRPLSHSELQLPIDKSLMSSEEMPSQAKTPPVPAPRSLTEKPTARRGMEQKPKGVADTKLREGTTRPNGPPAIKPKPRVRHSPATKPKQMDHVNPNSSQNERDLSTIPRHQTTEKINQAPIQIQPENYMVNVHVEGVICDIPEVSHTDNFANHHSPASSELYWSPVTPEQSIVSDMIVESVRPIKSLNESDHSISDHSVIASCTDNQGQAHEATTISNEPTMELQGSEEKQVSILSQTEGIPRAAITDPNIVHVQSISPSRPKRRPPAEHVCDKREESLQTGSAAESPIDINFSPQSQFRQSPTEKWSKRLQAEEPPASPVQCSPGKRKIPPPPPPSSPSIKSTKHDLIVSGQEEVSVAMSSELALPYSEESSEANASVAPDNLVINSLNQSKSGGPPSRPPPKPPRSLASQSIKRLPAMTQSKEVRSPTTAGYHVLVHQGESGASMTSATSVFSDEIGDSDGWGSEFDSDSPEEEEGPLRPKVYHIAREIMTTEQTFVSGLQLLHEDFRRAVSDAAGKPVVGDEMMSRILQNTEQLFQFNSEMLAQLQERIEDWDNCAKIGDIMKRNAPFLKLYTPYIQNFDAALKALEEAVKKSGIFEKLVHDFEQSPKCNNLPVSAYMLETVQRIPRYKLLLQDYIKHLPVDSEDKRDATEALAIVSSVAAHVNEGFKKKDKFQRVLDIQRKLIGKGSGDIVKPGREFLKQGRLMKVCRKDLQPRVLFLFSDTLLYTHEVPAGQYGLDAVLPLTGMRVAELLATQYRYAFTIVSTRKSFQLLAENEEERDDWISSLKNAIRENQIKHKSFNPQLHGWAKAMVDPAEAGTPSAGSEFKLGEMAPVWISDDSVSMCMGCMVHFTVTRRRHHCRSCGKVLCGSCSSLTHYLNYLKKIARVCNNCYDTLEEGVGNEWVISLPKNEAEVVLRHEEQEDATDSKAKIKRRKSKLRHSKRKLPVPKLPAVLTEVQARDANAQMSGYLDLRQGRKWKRRWFVAHNMILYRYKRHEDIAATATMPLLGYRLCKVEKRDGIDKKETEFSLKLDHPGTESCILKADTETEFNKWWYVLELAIRGEKPLPQDDSELQKSPDTEIASPGSDSDKPLSPIDMATVTANSIGFSESGGYSYAVIPLQLSASSALTGSPKSAPRTPTVERHVYEEIKLDQKSQFSAVAHQGNPPGDTVVGIHQNVHTTGAVSDNGVIERADVLPAVSGTIDEQYDIQGNPLYGTHLDSPRSARQPTAVLPSTVESQEYEIQGNPLYQHQSDALGQDYNQFCSSRQFHEFANET